MSNRQLKVIFVLCSLMVIGTGAICYILDDDAVMRQKDKVEFVHIQDTPVVNSLEDYYKLIEYGEVDLQDGKLYLKDLTFEDRRQLQLMLRTP